MSVLELRSQLDDLNVVMARDLDELWSFASALAPGAGKHLVWQTYPEVVTPYLSAAGELSAGWYDSLAPERSFRAAPAELPTEEALQAGAATALGKPAMVPLLLGEAQRALFNQGRDTIVGNAGRERIKWARYASRTACAWCRMLATRDVFYTSRDRAAFRAHPWCRCMAEPVRGTGEDHTFMPWVDEWKTEYDQAKELAGSTEAKELMKAYRQLEKERG